MTNDIFVKRRNKVIEMMDDGIAIIPGASLAQKSNDTDFPFRQNSHFFYLTGLNEPDAILVLCKNSQKKSHIFVRPKDPIAEMWMGARMGPVKAPEVLGVDQGYSNQDFQKTLGELITGHKNLYIDIHGDQKTLSNIRTKMQEVRYNRRKDNAAGPKNLMDLTVILEKLRLVKDESEITLMKKAIYATDIAHRASMAMATPGKSEKDIWALIQYLFKKEGADAEAYDSIVAAGNNANILHYIENNQALNDGDLLLIDAGSQKDLYASDITRTFPVNGKFTAAQKEVYEIVLSSQKAALEMAIPGKGQMDVHMAASKVLAQGLIDLKVLSGSVDSIIESGDIKKFYPHGTGHWLGLDVHDQNLYVDENGKKVVYDQGMIFTIEPGLYFNSNNTDIPKHLRGIGIRIEDNILITKDGHENMSSMIPKKVSDVEQACAVDYRDFLIN